jgi:hypothetical protein
MRNRASYGAGLADALLKQGTRHHQDAVAAAVEVLPALEGGVTSVRCLNRLRLVRQSAGNTSGAQEFCERFDAVDRALIASFKLPGDDTSTDRADVPALWHGKGHDAASARRTGRVEPPSAIVTAGSWASSGRWNRAPDWPRRCSYRA